MPLSMRVDAMVGAIVRQLLIGTGGRDDEALHLHLDCRMGYYEHVNEGRDSYHSSRGLHLLYFLRKGYSYVSVFSAVTSSPFTKVREVDNWKHETTHDSCWRDVGIFSQVYFEMAKDINSQLVSDGFSEVAPAAMSEHNSFPVFNAAFSWEPVEVITDPTCDRSYRKLIKLK